MNILCMLGWHRWRYLEKWLPSFEAEVIEKVIIKKICKRCSKEIVLTHLTWDYEEKDWTPESF